MGAGDIKQRQVFRGRTHKDQIVVLGIVQRKQTASLYANLAVQLTKNVVQSIDRQHLAHPGVMVVDGLSRIRRGIEVAQSSLCTPDESAVAESHPRFF